MHIRQDILGISWSCECAFCAVMTPTSLRSCVRGQLLGQHLAPLALHLIKHGLRLARLLSRDLWNFMKFKVFENHKILAASRALKCNHPGIGVNLPATFTTCQIKRSSIDLHSKHLKSPASCAQIPPRKAQNGWIGVSKWRRNWANVPGDSLDFSLSQQNFEKSSKFPWPTSHNFRWSLPIRFASENDFRGLCDEALVDVCLHRRSRGHQLFSFGHHSSDLFQRFLQKVYFPKRRDQGDFNLCHWQITVHCKLFTADKLCSGLLKSWGV